MPEPEETNLFETAGRLLQIVLRRRWWFLVIASGVVIGTAVVLMQLPNRYTSEATLLVVAQQVPERYVASTTTTAMSEALQAMTQEVLSRTRLQSIITEFGLYQEERRRLAPERVIDLIRRDIGIEPLQGNSDRRSVNSFKISFTIGSPDVAQQVTSRLASLFIAENLKTREDQATNTAEFLGAQLTEAETKLAEQEKRIRDFKMRYLGELPEQQQGNLAILTGLQTQLQTTAAALSRAEQQRVYLESLVRGYESIAAVGEASAAAPEITPVPGPIQDAQLELARLQTERRRLSAVYTPNHPDVLQNNGAIEKAEANLARLQAAQSLLTEGGQARAPRPTPGSTQQESTLAQVKSQLEANRVETENLSRDYKNIQATIEKYQIRLNQTPIREQQLATVLRDHDLLRQDYSELLRKKLEAELATNLEKQQAGQQFRLVDAPSLPTVPTSPQRVKMSLIGVLAGVFLGAGVAFLVDFRGRPFYAEKAVCERFAKTLVVGVPVLRTPAEQRTRLWFRALEWVSGTVLAAAVLLTEFYVYLHG